MNDNINLWMFLPCLGSDNQTFSTVMSRPSRTLRFKCFIQRSASALLSIVMKANPRDSPDRGSLTNWHSTTLNHNQMPEAVSDCDHFTEALKHQEHMKRIPFLQR